MKLHRSPLWLLGMASIAVAAPPDGSALYAKHCAICHETLAVIQNHVALKSMPPEYIVRALTSGVMRKQGAGLTKEDRAAIATYLAGRPLGPVIDPAIGRCTSTAPSSPGDHDWNGWGADLENTRFQPAAAAGLTADQVPRLKLKWAFGLPEGFSAFAQPSIVDGRVYVGSAAGIVYALNAASGCTYWSFEAKAGVRGAVTIGGGTAYFGDLRANVYAVNARTGRLVWMASVEDHPAARVTGSPKLYQGRLYVPVASREEWLSASSKYECCTFRGSVVALDAATGKQLWKTFTIEEAPRPTVKTKEGTQRWGPSGVGVWTSPTIDARRGVLYVGTGDGYSDPATRYSDSILALDLAGGRIVWARQITEGDVFNGNCIQARQSTCPDKVGPDSDFGSSPILRTLASGRRVLIAGQKSGVVHALDPDKQGAVIWQTRIGKGGMLGGIQWGPTADDTSAYIALSDLGLIPAADGMGLIPDPKAGGGLFALQLATGEKLWSALPPPGGCTVPRCSPAQSAAVTAIPGMIFSGALDGHLRAYSASDGRIVWDFDTVRDFPTVNGIPARGGSLDGPGPAVAGGILVVNSGYAYFNGIPGNALLAFGVE